MNLPTDVALGDVCDALAELDSRLFDLERTRMYAVVGILGLLLLVWLLSSRIDALEDQARRELKLWSATKDTLESFDRRIDAAHNRARELEVRARALEDGASGPLPRRPGFFNRLVS